MGKVKLHLLVFIFSINIQLTISVTVLAHLPYLNFKECKRECDKNYNCNFGVYQKNYGLCELYGSDPVQCGDHFNSKVYRKEIGETITSCDQCTSTQKCVESLADVLCINGCGDYSVPSPGMVIHGNMHMFGAKVKFSCLYSGEPSYFTCSDEGTWEGDMKRCGCSLPTGLSLQNGHFEIKELKATHDYANLTCANGFEPMNRDIPACNIESKQWTSFRYSCCLRLRKESWIKVFEYSSPFVNSIFHSYTVPPQEGLGPQCQYRSDMIDTWDSHSIKFMKYEIIKNDQVQAFMTFYCLGCDSQNWFNLSHLTNSSWGDLNALIGSTNEVERFSFYAAGDSPSKWNVMKVWSSNLCKQVGWTTVTWHNFPCDEEVQTAARIIFAEPPSMAITKAFKQADRIEIWVEQ